MFCSQELMQFDVDVNTFCRQCRLIKPRKQRADVIRYSAVRKGFTAGGILKNQNPGGQSRCLAEPESPQLR